MKSSDNTNEMEALDAKLSIVEDRMRDICNNGEGETLRKRLLRVDIRITKKRIKDVVRENMIFHDSNNEKET